MTGRCDAPKVQGSETLLCTLDAGHDEGGEATWHQATVTDHRQMDFGTARIDVRTEETITWQPLRVTLGRTLKSNTTPIAAYRPSP